MSTRLRCAEFIIDKTWPKEAQNTILGAIGGVEWLELRFTAPGGSTESHRIDLEPSVEKSVGETIDLEAEASDVSELGDEHEG